MDVPSPQVESCRWSSQAPLVSGKCGGRRGSSSSEQQQQQQQPSCSLPPWLLAYGLAPRVTGWPPPDAPSRCAAGGKLNATINSLESQDLKIQF